MKARAKKLLAEALRLPPGERAELAERLFSSLHMSQEELDRLWAEEAGSRVGADAQKEMKSASARMVFENIFSQNHNR